MEAAKISESCMGTMNQNEDEDENEDEERDDSKNGPWKAAFRFWACIATMNLSLGS